MRRNRTHGARVLVALVCLACAWAASKALMPGAALAEELQQGSDASRVVIQRELNVDQSSEDFQSPDIDNYAMFDSYVRQELDELVSNGQEPKVLTAQSARDNLTGINLAIYDQLRPMLLDVAAGKSTNTVFKVRLVDVDASAPYYVYASDYGLQTFDGNQNAINDAGKKYTNRWLV